MAPGFIASHLSKYRKEKEALPFFFFFNQEGKSFSEPPGRLPSGHFGQTESHAFLLAASWPGKVREKLWKGNFNYHTQGEQAQL